MNKSERINKLKEDVLRLKSKIEIRQTSYGVRVGASVDYEEMLVEYVQKKNELKKLLR